MVTFLNEIFLLYNFTHFKFIYLLFLLTTTIVNRISVYIESKYQLLQNDQHTRDFLTIPVIDPRGEILGLIGKVNEVLGSFRQPTYYEVSVYVVLLLLVLIVLV